MAKTIWKFPLGITDQQDIRLPTGSKVLHVDWQDRGSMRDLCLWAVVDPQAPMVTRAVRIYGTGHAFDDRPHDVHAGTVIDNLNRLVWHVFVSTLEAV